MQHLEALEVSKPSARQGRMQTTQVPQMPLETSRLQSSRQLRCCDQLRRPAVATTLLSGPSSGQGIRWCGRQLAVRLALLQQGMTPAHRHSPNSSSKHCAPEGAHRG